MYKRQVKSARTIWKPLDTDTASAWLAEKRVERYVTAPAGFPRVLRNWRSIIIISFIWAKRLSLSEALCSFASIASFFGWLLFLFGSLWFLLGPGHLHLLNTCLSLALRTSLFSVSSSLIPPFSRP